MIYAIYYIASIVAANVAFSYLPPIPLPGGGILPMATFVVGLTFVMRDLTQRHLGHGVLLPMAIAILWSYQMADPMVVTASVAAFTVSELADWAIYTITKAPIHTRIIVSSLVATPLDSIVFLGLLPFPGTLNITAVLTMTLAKLVASFVWWSILKSKHEQLLPQGVGALS